ncbi:reverse transcriptase domain-containing protein [Mesonia sediminis]|jgi:hypothetical protein|uniref:Reverse transcriptase domain-containing protein n=1 Tax=Mesonia sediminis TaxID=1703946 RepID=A0ABW5SAN7_9FLAO
MAVKDWYKLKQYPHIGLPFKPRDKSWLVEYVKDPDRIKKHRFTPFIKREIIQRKFRPENSDKNVYGKRIRKPKDPPKKRPILYASHLDSLIFSYYSYYLSVMYECYLRRKTYKDCPVAYRKIRKGNKAKGNKSNIEFAHDAFSAINNFKGKPVSIIVADVSNFFDELDHKILHHHWKLVLNKYDDKNRLTMPDDHYNVFKALTKKRYVKINELHNTFYDRLWVERNKPNNPKKIIWKQKKVSKRVNFKRERVIAFCKKKDFYKYHSQLVYSERRGEKGLKQHKNSFSKKGIPQGSPMSATLANIYMLSFDEAMYNAITSVGGFYQRYSDDLILICPRESENFIHQTMLDAIRDTNSCNLNIHPDKTKLYRYSFIDGYYKGGLVCPEDKVNTYHQLEYLGFEYTGKRVYVKAQGISKYYRSMIRSIKRGKFYANKKHHKHKGLFKNKLFKRFTILGGKRVLKRIPDPKRPNKYLPDPEKTYNWGNYFSYLMKANSVMKDLNENEDTINKQTRKFESNFHRLIRNKKTKLKPTKRR